MDAGLIGALIGVGFMACVAGAYFLHEYASAIKKRWKRSRQSLLPVVQQSPLLIRTVSKQFQMKDLF
jgi:hypothetical protein